MAFKYRKPTEASVKEQSEQSGGQYASMFVEGIPEFKAKKGQEYTVRIAPQKTIGRASPRVTLHESAG